ncbi:ribonuclease H1 [Mycena latifolia]|nr:ribonuclease H1 [Mycena latifolia]
MPLSFFMDAWTDGACRRNGYHDAVAGAGVFFPHFPDSCRSDPLPRFPHPTNQRAELTAIILALDAARSKQLSIVPFPAPYFVLTVHTDSRYAVDCMHWINTWLVNGWKTSEGQDVQNKDLIQGAHELRLDIERTLRGGHVQFKWVPRTQNQEADRLANAACDQAERALDALYYQRPSESYYRTFRASKNLSQWVRSEAHRC